jgi:hypothetical protein
MDQNERAAFESNSCNFLLVSFVLLEKRDLQLKNEPINFIYDEFTRMCFHPLFFSLLDEIERKKKMQYITEMSCDSSGNDKIKFST